MARAADNKWLRVNVGVRLSPATEPVVIALEPWFERAGILAFVTSGKRDRDDQLRVIRSYALENNVQREFPGVADPALAGQVAIGNNLFPLWQAVWGRLLTLGVLVNPPERAAAPFRYFHPVNKVWIDAGTMVNASSHFAGSAFDIGARTDLERKVAVVQDAQQSGQIPGLVSITPEHANHAIHIECRAV